MMVNNYRIAAAAFCRLHCTTLIELAIYVVCTAFYKLVVHIEFHTILVPRLMHYLDLWLLKYDLLTSLWYLHVQPPVMNLILGIALKIGGADYGIVWGIFYFFVGMVAIVYLERTLAMLGVRTSLRLLMCAWLCIHPAFILYANLAYAQHLEFCLCCIVLCVLVRLLDKQVWDVRDGMALGVPLMILGLIRPQWDLLFLVGLLVAVCLVYRGHLGQRKLIAGGLAALSPILLLWIKNFIVFGFLGTSSWMGANLGQVASELYPSYVLQQMRDRGEISSFYPVDFSLERAEMAEVEWLKTHKDLPYPMNHPSLQQRKKSSGGDNNNYAPTILGSERDLKDSLTIISRIPETYVKEVAFRMWLCVQEPSYLMTNSLPWFGDQDKRHHRNYGPYTKEIIFGTVAYYVYIPLLVVGIALWSSGYIAQRRPVIVTGAIMMLFISITSNAFTYGGESAWMRWPMEPFYLTFFALLVEEVWRMIPHIIPRIIPRKNHLLT